MEKLPIPDGGLYVQTCKVRRNARRKESGKERCLKKKRKGKRGDEQEGTEIANYGTDRKLAETTSALNGASTVAAVS